MSRLPIRLRLGLSFALAMGIVLAATGAFLYVRLASSLDESVDEVLEARLVELGARLAEGGAQLDLGVGNGLVDTDERFAQLLDDMSGGVVDATAQVGAAQLLNPDDLALARGGVAVRHELDEVPGIAGRARLLATGVGTPEGRRVLVVGASLEDRDETMRQFLVILGLAGPVALLLTSLLGYALATAALRPVEFMRDEAAAISASEPGRRLPLPSSHDEIRRLGETLNEMLDRLDEGLERERRFVADASHELRTPLALLKTELEIALAKPRSAADLEGALRSASVETDRLVQLAEDLLLISRADEGGLPILPTRLEVEHLLASVARRFDRRVAASGRRIEVESNEGLALEADQERILQALSNLVDNALRHGDGVVLLKAVELDDAVEIHVLDEGSGFPPGLLPRAFERFSQSDESRESVGTGLGLAIVEAIARAHGGSARVANGERGGADVWLILPKRLNGVDAVR